MATHTWKGHTIEVGSYPVSQLLWFGISFSVLVDGSSSFRSPNHLEGFQGTVPFEISDSGTLYHGRLVSGRACSALRASYRLFVGDQEIASGIVRARNWYVTYGLLLAGMLVLSFLLYLIHIHKHVA